MSRYCQVCERGPRVAYQLSHSHRRTKRRWAINLQRKRFFHQGRLVRGYICTRCLSSDKVQVSI